MQRRVREKLCHLEVGSSIFLFLYIRRNDRYLYAEGNGLVKRRYKKERKFEAIFLGRQQEIGSRAQVRRSASDWLMVN